MDDNITCQSVVLSAGDMKPKQAKNRIIDHLCLNFDEPIRDWLERREGYPQKVIQQGCPGASFRIATMGKSDTIVLQKTNTLDAPEDLIIKAPHKVIKSKISVTTLAFGFSNTHRNSLGELIPLLASGHSNGDIYLWHGDFGNIISPLISHKGPVTQIIFSGETNSRHQVQTEMISVSHDRTAKVWDFEDNGQNMKNTINFPFSVNCFAWSPNAKLVAFGGNCQKIYLHHKSIGGSIHQKSRHLLGHLHSIVGLKFWPDGSLIVSASYDGRIHISDPYVCEIRQVLTLDYPLPKFVFKYEMISCDVDRFGRVVSLTDKGHFSLWNPMTKFSYFHEGIPIQIDSYEDLLIDDFNFQSCCFALGDRYILASNYTFNFNRSIAIGTPVPSLKHLVRLSIRKLQPDSRILKNLPLPKTILKYLGYELWV